MERITLTPREYDVLVRLNIANKEIANELYITERTVKAVVNSLSQKFRVRSRSAIIIRALKFGLVELAAFRL